MGGVWFGFCICFWQDFHQGAVTGHEGDIRTTASSDYLTCTTMTCSYSAMMMMMIMMCFSTALWLNFMQFELPWVSLPPAPRHATLVRIGASRLQEVEANYTAFSPLPFFVDLDDASPPAIRLGLLERGRGSRPLGLRSLARNTTTNSITDRQVIDTPGLNCLPPLAMMLGKSTIAFCELIQTRGWWIIIWWWRGELGELVYT